MSTLSGKTLFITGASRGIGRAIALRAARDGANIAIAAKTDKPHPKLPGTIFTATDEIVAAGGKALPLVVDVRDEAQVRDAIERTVATFGTLDIVVNNASAVSRNVLLGMVPKRTHAPPTLFPFSITITLLPAFAPCTAAFCPAGPPPMTARSKCSALTTAPPPLFAGALLAQESSPARPDRSPAFRAPDAR